MATTLTREERLARLSPETRAQVLEVERSIAAKDATRAALDAEFPYWCRVIGGWSNQTQYECEMDGETLLGDAYTSEGNADELAMARLLKACRMHVERREARAQIAETDAAIAQIIKRNHGIAADIRAARLALFPSTGHAPLTLSTQAAE